MSGIRRKLAAEATGTAFLAATVVGSALTAERLGADAVFSLLSNALATGAMLVVLITVLGPVSGAHLNPAVTLVAAFRREFGVRDTALYVIAQIAGGTGGTALAHAMFAQPVLQLSLTQRSGGGLWFSEAVATFGLIAVIIMGGRFARTSVAGLVGLYVGAAYWFTASTAFANPAVTLARALTRSAPSINQADVPAFIAAQIAGAMAALAFSSWLLAEPASKMRGATAEPPPASS